MTTQPILLPILRLIRNSPGVRDGIHLVAGAPYSLLVVDKPLNHPMLTLIQQLDSDYSYHVCGELDLTWLTAQGVSRITYNRSMPVQTLYSHPGGEFMPIYDVDVPVTCDQCLETFLFSQLKSDDREFLDVDGFDGWQESDRICPHCGEWDCCRVRKETVAEFQARCPTSAVEVP